MYKVMIIDDEMLVRIGLKSLIDWNKIGFEIVAEAGNGETAYEKYLVHKPDVVITDIKMPKKDGLWLVKKIKENNKETEIILLTCHDEFDYAREAIRLNVSDYILKAEMEEQEIQEIMLSKKKILDQKRDNGNILEDEKQEKFDNDGYLLGLLLNDKKDMGTVKKAFVEYGIDWNTSHCCLLQFDFKASLKEKMNDPKQNAKIISACFELIVNKYERENTICIAKQFGKSIACCIIGNKLNKVKVENDIINLRTTIKQYLNISFKSVVSPIVEKIENIRQYTSCFIESADLLFYIPNGESMLWPKNFNQVKEKFAFDYQITKRLYDYIENENTESIESLIQELKSKMIESKGSSFEIKLEVSYLIKDIIKQYEEYIEIPDNISRVQKKVIDAEDVDEIIGILHNFILDFIKTLLESRIGNSDMIIRKAVDFINEHYSEKISLDHIADSVGISKYYFSTLFKKEMGINFTSYLNQIRIEKAKKLLKNPIMTVSQIYYQVGFSDQQYFSKIFKKYVGITVTEYRNKVEEESF